MEDSAATSTDEREVELLLALEQVVRAAQFPNDRRFRAIHTALYALDMRRKP